MKTFIIGEIGVNHQGDPEIAKDLVGVAIDAGADAVKFQAWKKGRFPNIEHLRLSKKYLAWLKAYTEAFNKEWMCTAFDLDTIDWLKELGIKLWKIPSGMVTNLAYLNKIASLKPQQIIVSTGMCDQGEINKIFNYFTPDKYVYGKDIFILHCTTLYPTPLNQVNLEVLRLPIFDGLSDHSATIEVPVAAVAMGASIIEVHITLSRNQAGPDHQASLEPKEFATMVKMIRNIEVAVGDGVKRPTKGELQVRNAIREKMNER